MRKAGSKITIIALMVLMAISVFKIGEYYLRYAENEAMYREVKETVFEESGKQNDKKKDSKAAQNPYENPDRIGWIRIPGTKIDYPVMQSKDRKNFYLKHDYYKNPSAHGCPYLQENCIIGESDNLIVYGHHMSDGTMFAGLDGYVRKDFWKAHRKTIFTVGKTQQEYEVFCVFKTSEKGDFAYTAFTKAESEKEFNAYIRQCEKRAFYDTGISARYGDKLLTLSTCEYTLENGRLVVVAKNIHGKEGPDGGY